MGSGTLIELVARGKQDVFIIGNPNYTYFKSVYRRHTNFSIEPIRNAFNEQPNFGVRTTCNIDKKGDLLNALILEIELPALQPLYSWVNGIGNFIIDFVEVQFGGETIDRISGQLLDVWSELTTESSIKSAYYDMIGKYFTYSQNTAFGAQHLFVPLPFWFCRDLSQSLPLIAMQYTTVSIVVQFKPFDACWYKYNNIDSENPIRTWPNDVPIPQITDVTVYGDYIYLDTYERRKFAEMTSFECLIEQFQTCDSIQKYDTANQITAPFYLNHPVKELIWVYKSAFAAAVNDHVNYSNIVNYNTYDAITNKEPIQYVELRYNGNDRFQKRHGKYFWRVQPYQRHTYGPDQYIYVFSFAADPEDLQPSGTCNFSKIDDAKFIFHFNHDNSSTTPEEGNITIYARNYNILKISSGMAGVLFSS